MTKEITVDIEAGIHSQVAHKAHNCTGNAVDRSVLQSLVVLRGQQRLCASVQPSGKAQGGGVGMYQDILDDNHIMMAIICHNAML